MPDRTPIRAVLFDLDGTLLAYDYTLFEAKLLAGYAAFFARKLPGVDVMKPMMGGIAHMMAGKHTAIVEEAFWSTFLPPFRQGKDEFYGLFVEFYEQALPKLGEGIGPDPHASAVLAACRDRGCTVVLATNPVFSMLAIEKRLRWGAFDAGQFDLVTSIERMHATKPNPPYYAEIAEMIGVEPAACIMVGNDEKMDLAPAAAVGMRTVLVDNPFQVRNGKGFVPDHVVPLAAVPSLL